MFHGFQQQFARLNDSGHLSRTFEATTYKAGARLVYMIKTIILLLAVVAVLGAQWGTAHAEVAQLNGNGGSDGYAKGHADFLNGASNNNSCNPVYGDAYCAAYEIGYAAGWTAAHTLYCGSNPQSSNC